jgi:hypothetical protein
MTESEKKAIEQFAAGDVSLRAEAIAIHRRNIPTVGIRGNLHQKFMAEIDNKSPDLALRMVYRAELTNIIEASR